MYYDLPTTYYDEATDAATTKSNKRCSVKLRLDNIYTIPAHVKQVLVQMYYNTTPTNLTRNTNQASNLAMSSKDVDHFIVSKYECKFIKHRN